MTYISKSGFSRRCSTLEKGLYSARTPLRSGGQVLCHPMQSMTCIELGVLGMLRFTLFGVLEVEMSMSHTVRADRAKMIHQNSRPIQSGSCTYYKLQIHTMLGAGHLQFDFQESRYTKDNSIFLKPNVFACCSIVWIMSENLQHRFQDPNPGCDVESPYLLVNSPLFDDSLMFYTVLYRHGLLLCLHPIMNTETTQENRSRVQNVTSKGIRYK